MILVDSSVIIDYTRGKDPKLQALLLGLPVAVCGVVRAEVLHGARDPAHRQKLLTELAPFTVLPFPIHSGILLGTIWRHCEDEALPCRCRMPLSPLWESSTTSRYGHAIRISPPCKAS